MTAPTVALREDQYSNLEKLAVGALSPLQGFMNEQEFLSVIEDLMLPDGQFFPYPIGLDISDETAASIRHEDRVLLRFRGVEVGEMRSSGVFRIDKASAARKIFGVDDPRHPGVRRFLESEPSFVGGAVRLFRRIRFNYSNRELLPSESKTLFTEKGWKTIVGFATRNVPHRGHEYLHRVALEQADGLFIHATIGIAATGEFTPDAIVAGCDAMVDGYYGPHRAVVSLLTTPSYLAGPREALLQALLRRNYGCTHFIIGRDHAGVGGYYGEYDAHELSRRYDDRLGVTILRMHGPYFCRTCDSVVTERHCRHMNEPGARLDLRATSIREGLSSAGTVDPRLMRPAVLEAIRGTTVLH